MCSLETDNINLHVQYFIEDHMGEQDLLKLTLPGYASGLIFRSENPQKGGVCIFVRKYKLFRKIDISRNYKNDLEICAR